MNMLIAFLLIISAGMINGSFALPTKYVTRWKFENIWLNYAIWAFIILPWLISLALFPQILHLYLNVTLSTLLIMFIGGFVFGIGQVCFALAMDMIGLGLGFVINIGLGVSLGFLLPLVFQHPQEIFRPFGVITLIGTACAVIGLVLSSYAGQLHSACKNAANHATRTHARYYLIGVILAVIAGFSSAGQNLSFSLTASMQQIATTMGAQPLAASIVMWPGFLTCAFIPYAAYMLLLCKKNRSFSFFTHRNIAQYYLFAFIMGAFWYGSLIFYSKATHLIGNLGPLVGWPLFMSLIILTSNFWGWRHKEWEGCNPHVQKIILLGLLFLILAVMILGYSSWFHA